MFQIGDSQLLNAERRIEKCVACGVGGNWTRDPTRPPREKPIDLEVHEVENRMYSCRRLGQAGFQSAISNRESPIWNILLHSALSITANAKGCSKLVIHNC